MSPPTRQDIDALVNALSAVNVGPDRAGHRTKDAILLSLLRVIADHDGIRPSEIADRLQVQRPLVTCRVRESEDVGYVKVSHDPRDRRSLLVTLEPAGSDELRRLTDLSIDRLSRFVGDWEPDEVRRLTELLDKLRASMATASARQRRPREAVRGPGEPDWLIDFLGH